MTFSPDLRVRAKLALTSPAAARELEGLLSNGNPFGKDWYVDSVNGSDNNDGRSAESALATFDGSNGLFARSATSPDPVHFTSWDDVYVVNDIRAQVTAPLGVYGVRIIGASAGQLRNATESGAAVDGNGVSWREESTAANAPLLELRQQGWELHNILMTPESGYAAVKLQRQETATYPDASHFRAVNCRFTQSGSVGYGIEDYGGAHNVLIDSCEFDGLEYAWKQTNVSIASPLRVRIRRSRFRTNKNDITMNGSKCVIGGRPDEGNFFETVYHGTTHPNTVNLAFTASVGSNMVFNNYFADAAADVTIAKGYKPGTSDIWRNHVSDTAAYIVTVPA